MKHNIAFSAVYKTVLRLLLLNGIFLFLMSLSRLGFLLYFGDLASLGAQYLYVLKAFVMGFRFDLSVVAYINTIVTLSLLASWSLKRDVYFNYWLSFAKIYYFLMFSAVFLVITVDFGFYSYFQNHINILFFGIFEDDTKALFSTILENYNIALVLAGYALMFFVVYVISDRSLSGLKWPHRENGKLYPLPYKIVFVALVLVANTLAARGSLAMFPLNAMDASISPNVFINKLAINGIHTLFNAVEFRIRENKGYDFVKAMGYEGGENRAFADLLGVKDAKIPVNDPVLSLSRKTRLNRILNKEAPDVVIIMMEGFGSDLIKYNSPEFNVLGELKKHFDSDYVFYNFLSADVGTIGSLEALLLNIPKRPRSKPVTQSKYAFNKYRSAMALPFKNAGYETVFVYGGSAGWRGLDSFLPLAGFDAVDGQGSMEQSYLKNQWGVYDEFMFEHINKKLAEKTGRPKMIFALSTSNHPPYSLPPSYKQLPLKVTDGMAKTIAGDKELAKMRFATYQYSSQKLGEFITRVKRSKSGDNTIIAVTGDHNFWDVFEYDSSGYIGQYGVPLYIYYPKKFGRLKYNPDACGSHMDIMPTVYNLALSGAEYTALGSDMFDGAAYHFGANSEGFAVEGGAALKYFPDKGTVEFLRREKRALSPSPETGRHTELLKRYKASLAVADYMLKHP